MPQKQVHVRDHQRRKPLQEERVHVDDYNRIQDVNPRPTPGQEDLGPILTLLDRMADEEDKRREANAHYTLDGDPRVVQFVKDHYKLYDCGGTGKTKIYAREDPANSTNFAAIFADKVEANGDFLEFYRNGEISGQVADSRLRTLHEEPKQVEDVAPKKPEPVYLETANGKLRVTGVREDSLGYHIVTGDNWSQRTFSATRQEYDKVRVQLEAAGGG
jgi:hypothetical protein